MKPVTQAERDAWCTELKLSDVRVVTEVDVMHAFRTLSLERHPDKGGSDAAMASLIEARKLALRDLAASGGSVRPHRRVMTGLESAFAAIERHMEAARRKLFKEGFVPPSAPRTSSPQRTADTAKNKRPNATPPKDVVSAKKKSRRSKTVADQGVEFAVSTICLSSPYDSESVVQWLTNKAGAIGVIVRRWGVCKVIIDATNTVRVDVVEEQAIAGTTRARLTIEVDTAKNIAICKLGDWTSVDFLKKMMVEHKGSQNSWNLYQFSKMMRSVQWAFEMQLIRKNRAENGSNVNKYEVFYGSAITKLVSEGFANTRASTNARGKWVCVFA